MPQEKAFTKTCEWDNDCVVMAMIERYTILNENDLDR